MRRQKISLALNLLIIFLEMIGFVFAFSNHGWSALIYYTELSNILLFVAAMFYVCYTVWDLQGQKIKMPRYVPLLKYVATLSVAITFIVVITVLSWATKYSLWTLLTQQSMLFHHTLCPILAILSFLFFEKYRFKKIRCSDRDELYATLCSRRHFLQFNWRVSRSVSVLNGLCAAMVGIAALVHRNFGWRLRFSATLTMGTKEINDAGELTPEYHKRFRLQ